MNEISGLLAALAALGIIRAWNAAEEDRASRREEVFVSFNLPPYRSGNNQSANQKQMLLWRYLPFAPRQRSSQEYISHCIPGFSLALKGATAGPWRVLWHSREQEHGSAPILSETCKHLPLLKQTFTEEKFR